MKSAHNTKLSGFGLGRQTVRRAVSLSGRLVILTVTFKINNSSEVCIIRPI